MLKQLLKQSRAVQRLKAVKDLLLNKLDSLQRVSEQQFQQGEQLLDNQVFLLRAALDSVKLLGPLQQQSEQQSQQQQQLLAGQAHLSAQGSQSLDNQVFLLKAVLDSAKLLESLQVSHQHQQADLQHIWQEFGKIRDEAQSNNQRLYQEFQHIRDEAQGYHQLLVTKFLELQHDNQDQASSTKTTLAQIATDVHDQKFKLVTDPSYFQAIEIELMVYLYSFLPHRRAIDVGANRGDVSARLLQTGYEVYAFEPFPPVFTQLKNQLGDKAHFHAFPYALGDRCETRDLHIAADQTADQTYEDATFYNSLTPHSLADGLVFTETLPVTVKTLASLHEAGELPADIGLVKIDTEGFDLPVIRGMADFRYPVVVAEFWDPSFPFGQTGAMNHLQDLVPAMREQGYGWHLVIYRLWGNHDISFYCNAEYSLANSWGNVFFFQDHAVFSEAVKWCHATMPATYFGA
jgi:FkbM family methyltransferase